MTRAPACCLLVLLHACQGGGDGPGPGTGVDSGPADPCEPQGHLVTTTLPDGGLLSRTCHCHGRSIPAPDGLSCLALDGGPGTPDASAQPDDPDGCGAHGTLHAGHCHCDQGYVEDANLTCVPLPACSAPDDSFEPNNLPSQATPWSMQVETAALRACPQDVDFYSVPVQSGQAVTATISFSHQDGDLDLYLWAPGLDPDGSQPTLASESYDDNETITYTAAAAGTVHLAVIPFQGAQAPYTLSLVVAQP